MTHIDPHELWPEAVVKTTCFDMDQLRPYVVFFGGWALHLLSPPKHTERKPAHDHDNAGVYVPERLLEAVQALLTVLGYTEDKNKAEGFFFHHSKKMDGTLIVLDVFVGDPPTLVLPGGVKVVNPEVLVDLCGGDESWGMTAVTKLLENGETIENIIGNGYLTNSPDEAWYLCTKCGWSGQFPHVPDFSIPHASKQAICGRCCYTVFDMGALRYQSKAQQHEELRTFMDFLHKESVEEAVLEADIVGAALKAARNKGQTKGFQETYGNKKK